MFFEFSLGVKGYVLSFLIHSPGLHVGRQKRYNRIQNMRHCIIYSLIYNCWGWGKNFYFIIFRTIQLNSEAHFSSYVTYTLSNFLHDWLHPHLKTHIYTWPWTMGVWTAQFHLHTDFFFQLIHSAPVSGTGQTQDVWGSTGGWESMYMENSL